MLKIYIKVGLKYTTLPRNRSWQKPNYIKTTKPRFQLHVYAMEFHIQFPLLQCIAHVRAYEYWQYCLHSLQLNSSFKICFHTEHMGKLLMASSSQWVELYTVYCVPFTSCWLLRYVYCLLRPVFVFCVDYCLLRAVHHSDCVHGQKYEKT